MTYSGVVRERDELEGEKKRVGGNEKMKDN